MQQMFLGLGAAVSYNWNGDRAIGGGGRNASGADINNIAYFSISNTSGDASDFGDLSAIQYGTNGTSGGASSAVRGIFWGGWEDSQGNGTNKIEYITIASTGNASDFGDRTQSTRQGFGSCSNGTRCCYAGGYGGSPAATQNVIEYITTMSTGNATDFGDLTRAGSNSSGTGDGSRGIFWGGSVNSDGSIQYITIESTGNATNFGALTGNSGTLDGSFGNGTHCMMGGIYPDQLQINKITVQTTGDATNVGDLTGAVEGMGGAGSAAIDRGVWFGGSTGPNYFNVTNNIQYITVSSGSNASDFSGDFITTRGMGALSGD